MNQTITPNFGELIKQGIPQKQRKPINGEMLAYTRDMFLNRWFPEIGFDPYEFMPSELDTLCAWVAAYGFSMKEPKQADRPRKSLLLCGPCGRGKTMIAKLLSKQFGLSFFTADELDRIATDPDSACYYSRRKVFSPDYDIVIDDLAAEPLRSRYGNSPEFPQLLQRLYESWNYQGKLIVATTNYSFHPTKIHKFVERYGERITDRLVEMFMSVKLDGRTNWRTIQRNGDFF